MKRPDIEDYERYINEECCGRRGTNVWCDSWGCNEVFELIRYIKKLEKVLEEKS